MKTSFKYGVSAVALLAAISLAQAQTSERQGGGASGSEHSMGGRGGESGHSAQGERGAQGGGASHEEHGQNGASMQHQGKSAEQGDHSGSQRGQSATQHEQEGAQSGEGSTRREHHQWSNRPSEPGNRASKPSVIGPKARRRGKARAEEPSTMPSKAKVSGARELSVRAVALRARRPEGVKRSSAARAGTRPQAEGGVKTTGSPAFRANKGPGFYGILVRDTAIHRYHRAEVDFPVQVGTRIPGTIEFYDAPAQVVQIDPVFQGYKIVVLDDVILVVDPVTREIVDVIRT